MSRWLANVLEEQNASDLKLETDLTSNVPALLIAIGDCRYVASFDQISEVIEQQTPLPYPEPREAHIGVINMRGDIVPVLSLASVRHTKSEGSRMVVFNTEAGNFAIYAESVIKRHLEERALKESSEIEVDGLVYKVLNASFLASVLEKAA